MRVYNEPMGAFEAMWLLSMFRCDSFSLTAWLTSQFLPDMAVSAFIFHFCQYIICSLDLRSLVKKCYPESTFPFSSHQH
jgi:hypothetical protein